MVYLDMIRTMQDRSLYFASLAHVEAYLQLYGTSPEILRLRADALRETGQGCRSRHRLPAIAGDLASSCRLAWSGIAGRAA